MGAKSSSARRMHRNYPGSTDNIHISDTPMGPSGTVYVHSGDNHNGRIRHRTRSLGGGVTGPPVGHPITFVVSAATSPAGASSVGQQRSSEERSRRRNGSHHQPSLHLFAMHRMKCPMCNKLVPNTDIECHLVMCFNKPKLGYNVNVLTEDKEEECVICFNDFVRGDVIARLPCLCIYHKGQQSSEHSNSSRTEVTEQQ